MKILKKKIDNLNNQEIFSINIVNDNNFEICFYNYGGYIKNIFIPYKKNRNEREDVILGYKNLAESYRSHGYFNSIIGRVCNRIGKSKFSINEKDPVLFKVKSFGFIVVPFNNFRTDTTCLFIFFL